MATVGAPIAFVAETEAEIDAAKAAAAAAGGAAPAAPAAPAPEPVAEAPAAPAPAAAAPAPAPAPARPRRGARGARARRPRGRPHHRDPVREEARQEAEGGSRLCGGLGPERPHHRRRRRGEGRRAFLDGARAAAPAAAAPAAAPAGPSVAAAAPRRCRRRRRGGAPERHAGGGGEEHAPEPLRARLAHRHVHVHGRAGRAVQEGEAQGRDHDGPARQGCGRRARAAPHHVLGPHPRRRLHRVQREGEHRHRGGARVRAHHARAPRHRGYGRVRARPRVVRAREEGSRPGLAPADYAGGNFTISNMGMFGVDAFDAILPPAKAASSRWAARNPPSCPWTA